ncbi:metallo-beta-lactamase domain-containing protein 1-like isoform X2 [Anneissia japonica]|uniref:metallo-beta-lactamase domain-containing protein 1-like isoform X2 n=1 Tax=Anneissia japonica TaxID=1529436 RepID=UPI0014257D04|nr:metallo-beta-lactamase domain-containing protein 1-like isoform X2 [Anneissia japonica]
MPFGAASLELVALAGPTQNRPVLNNKTMQINVFDPLTSSSVDVPLRKTPSSGFVVSLRTLGIYFDGAVGLSYRIGGDGKERKVVCTSEDGKHLLEPINGWSGHSSYELISSGQVSSIEVMDDSPSKGQKDVEAEEPSCGATETDSIPKAYEIIELKEGYSYTDEEGHQRADGSITLIKGQKNIMVDTGNAWDRQVILDGLSRQSLEADKIDYVVCSHGHSDHVGNLNLFLKAIQIVGFDINSEDKFIDHPFALGEPFKIDDAVDVIPTPGHTHNDVSVVVRNTAKGTVVVAGDLFEKMEDLVNAEYWMGNSEDEKMQEKNRNIVLGLADYIVPGHGPGFKVPLKSATKEQSTSNT